MNCRHCHVEITRAPEMDIHIASWRKHWPEEEIDAVEAWSDGWDGFLSSLKLICKNQALWHVPEVSDEDVIEGLRQIETSLR